MVFNTGRRCWTRLFYRWLQDREGTYGYKITQKSGRRLKYPNPPLYPVLRRLQKDECLEAYDMECAGRNRRYYKVTEKGRIQLALYKSEWKKYSAKISEVFEGGFIYE